MKKFFLLLSSVALFTGLFAQKTMQDVVYLKNGSILKGTITGTQPLKLEMAGGSTWVFSQAEVDSIGKELITKAKLKEIRSNYFRRNRGFMNMTEAGLIMGINLKAPDPNQYYYNTNSSPDIGISFHTVNGYRIWPYLFIGAGLGIDRYLKFNQTFSPFYGRLQSEFLKSKVTPYAYIDCGYSYMWPRFTDGYFNYKNKGGMYICTGLGVKVYTRSRASVIFSAGYKRQPSTTVMTYVTPWEGAPIYTTERLYQQLAVNIGVSF
jgi:hypothetical protein